MIEILRKSILFKNFDDEEIQEFLDKSGTSTKIYKKNEIIFDMEDEPKYIYILLDGSISINKDSFSGKRILVTKIDDIGDIFAEVYLFLNKNQYDFYTMSMSNKTKILRIPKNSFDMNSNSKYNHKLINNMLMILSQKAYNLTQKLQILSSGGIRQKIAQILLKSVDKNNKVTLPLNREELADYLNIARPSLSRELANMQNDGIIEVDGKNIKILDFEKLEQEI